MGEVRISLIRTETIDPRVGENRRAPFLARKPSGQCPAHALNNGALYAEITTFCECLDAIDPDAGRATL